VILALTLTELELREVLDIAVEDDLEEISRKKLGCVKKTSCVL
jgi:hypothetical protein